MMRRWEDRMIRWWNFYLNSISFRKPHFWENQTTCVFHSNSDGGERITKNMMIKRTWRQLSPACLLWGPTSMATAIKRQQQRQQQRQNQRPSNFDVASAGCRVLLPHVCFCQRPCCIILPSTMPLPPIVANRIARAGRHQLFAACRDHQVIALKFR